MTSAATMSSSSEEGKNLPVHGARSVSFDGGDDNGNGHIDDQAGGWGHFISSPQAQADISISISPPKKDNATEKTLSDRRDSLNYLSTRTILSTATAASTKGTVSTGETAPRALAAAASSSKAKHRMMGNVGIKPEQLPVAKLKLPVAPALSQSQAMTPEKSLLGGAPSSARIRTRSSGMRRNVFSQPDLTSLSQLAQALAENDITAPESASPMRRKLSQKLSSMKSDEVGMRQVPSCPDFGSLARTRQRVQSMGGLTFSEAKSMLWKLRFEGWLVKRGFSFRKAWKRRRVQLAGRNISYFTSQNDQWENKPRGKLELTKNTIVEACDEDQFEGKPYCFRIVPGHGRAEGAGGAPSWFDSVKSFFRGGGKAEAEATARRGRNIHGVWFLEAGSDVERDAWIGSIKRSIALINRVEAPPTLSGVGTIHDHYCIGEVVGAGRFGYVREAIARFTQEMFVVKAINKTKNVSTTRLAKVLGNEIRVMRKVTRETGENPHFMHILQAYEDTFMVYLVLDGMFGGTLEERIRASPGGCLSELRTSMIVKQLSSALDRLEGVGVVLCDLRPSNVLFTSRECWDVKIAEFGRAVLVRSVSEMDKLQREKKLKQKEQLKARSGRASTITAEELAKMEGGAKDPQTRKKSNSASNARQRIKSIRAPVHMLGKNVPGGLDPAYVAPEIVGSKTYSFACDVWALGCTTYTMLSGRPPFQFDQTSTKPLRPEMIFVRLMKGISPDQIMRDLRDVSADAVKMVLAMTAFEPTRRISAKVIRSSTFVTRALVVP